jgi:hypothetical protein
MLKERGEDSAKTLEATSGSRNSRLLARGMRKSE